jgi:3-hydroxybutyryl-CoA dehydrogenase
MKESGIRKIAVIGAGLMGFGVGVEFARFGYDVSMYNTRKESSENAMSLAAEALDLMVETKLITRRQADASYKRLHPTLDFEEAAADADFVHESVVDLLPLKMEVFGRLDDLCPPSTILATNTSSLLVSEIAMATSHPERVIATHYYQPPHFLPLVEVMPGRETSPAVVEKTAGFLRSIHKKVVVIEHESPGYIGNRLQGALGQAVRALIDEGVATPEMIDDVISYSFGRRMPFTAHFKQMDLRGLEFNVNSAKQHGLPLWKPVAEHVARGEMGMKSGKGFYDWSGGAANKLHHKMNSELIRWMKEDLDDGLI